MDRDQSRRRRFRRRTVRLPVRYTGAGRSGDEYATTLGAGGMFIETEEPLPAGTIVKIRFQLPGQDASHELEARVVWSQRGRPGALERTSGMGVAFQGNPAIAALGRALEKLPE